MPVRRSARATKPSQKYIVDPFEPYKELLIESEGEDTSSEDEASTGKLPSDEEFDEEQAAVELEEVEAGTDIEDTYSSNGVAGPVDASDSDDEVTEVTAREAKPKFSNVQPKRKHKSDYTAYNALPIFDPLGASASKGRNIHYTRGIPELSHNQGRENRVLYSVGVGEEDLVAHVQARDRWVNDVTIPYRKQSRDGIGGGLFHSPFYSSEKRQREMSDGMEWYYKHGGQNAFVELENFTLVENDVAEDLEQSASIVTGSITSPKKVEGLLPLESWNMGDVFGEAESGNDSWVLNVGGRVQGLDWAPNQDGLSQFLAVAIVSPESPGITESNQHVPLAYRAQASFSRCLQFWEIHALTTTVNAGSQVDFKKKPRLRSIISTNWGRVTRMKWCPAPDRSEDPKSQNVRLGLLAAIFEDGKIRVIDMAVEKDPEKPLQQIHLTSVAFESKPPNTICTCLAWLSSSDLAVGTADGNVAIWSIAKTLGTRSRQNKEQLHANSRPGYYQQLHQTFIHSITTGYPSRPYMIFTYSADGYIRATDLRSPRFDTTCSPRSRITQGPVVWHDITQAAMSADDNFGIRAFLLRIFHRGNSVARLTSFSADIAVSNLHSSVLAGCVDGTAWVTNPIRRLRDNKLRPSIQCVLKHEWRAPVQASNGRPDLNKKSNADVAAAGQEVQDLDAVLSKPLIRLTTGYRMQESEMGQETRVNATKDMVAFATIYEEKTSVTQVAWNPNLRAGTWAAMGMGSGLVIIRDLAAD